MDGIRAKWGKREGKVSYLKMCGRRKITGKTSCVMKWEMRQGEKSAEGCSQIWCLPSSPCQQSYPRTISLTVPSSPEALVERNSLLFTALVSLLPGQHFASVLKTYCPFSKKKHLYGKIWFGCLSSQWKCSLCGVSFMHSPYCSRIQGATPVQG